MTANEIKQAIKTIEVAIAEVEWNYPLDYAIAFETALEALTEKLARLENPPLTVEELAQMVGNPVFIVDTEIGIEDWYITGGSQWFADGYDTALNYGETWLAYRNKPESEG